MSFRRRRNLHKKLRKNELSKQRFLFRRNFNFTDQFQSDEIQPEFRRIIVRDYKILYKEEEGIVYIVKIFSTKQNPSKQL